MQPHTLLINIHPTLATSLEKSLSEQGYRVSQMSEAVPEPMQVQQVRPDLLIMMLPEADSHDLAPCRLLFAAFNAIPIMLLGRHSHDDRVESLNVCANDYLPIPFAMEEFLARIRAKLRRVSWEQKDELLVFGDLQLDAQSREVYIDDRAIELTAKEFDLLRYLMSYPRQVMTHEQIVDEVWPDSLLTDESNIVQVYVRSLRQKLGDAKDWIQTVRGVGYVLKTPAASMTE
ncbi:MAG: response regulator transcription factor [Leptolyngbya sp. SIOISBB]|nr:response regulator transcription factor [Leptolyngbya sp. SIOISBB]